MTKKVKLPLYLTWKKLKEIVGHPFSRTHTDRLMFDPEYSDRRFPKSTKLGDHRNSPPVWYTPDVLDYFKRHGLRTPDDIEFS